MLEKLMEAIFGCWHNNYSFPMTIRSRQPSAVGWRSGTYVVCLDCGKELPYDWGTMRVASRMSQLSPRPS